MDIKEVLQQIRNIADEVFDGFDPEKYTNDELEKVNDQVFRLIESLYEYENTPELQKCLILVLNSNHYETKEAAFNYIQSKDAETFVDVLKNWHKAPDYLTVKRAVIAINEIALIISSQTISGLKKLNDFAIVKSINNKLLEILFMFTDHSDWLIRSKTIQTLGLIGTDTKIKNVLENAAADKLEIVREDAQYALKAFMRNNLQ